MNTNRSGHPLTDMSAAALAATRADTLTKLGQSLGDLVEGAAAEDWPINALVHAHAALRNVKIATALLRARAEDLADPITGGVTTGMAERITADARRRRAPGTALGKLIRTALRLDALNHSLGHPDGLTGCIACESEWIREAVAAESAADVCIHCGESTGDRSIDVCDTCAGDDAWPRGAEVTE